MVDEAAGTRMYQVKMQDTQKLIEKKDAKLAEFQAVSEYLFLISSQYKNRHPLNIKFYKIGPLSNQLLNVNRKLI